jgi:hypothetical protein
MRALLGIGLILALTACAGSSNSIPQGRFANSAVTLYEGRAPFVGSVAETIVVQPSGSAVLTVETSPPTEKTATLARPLVAKLYSDLDAAAPLSSLPQTSLENEEAGSLIISVAGQTTPNILGESGNGGTLGADFVAIADAF